MIKSASCWRCAHDLPLGGEFLKLQLPPEMLVCGHCGSRNKTSFAYRANWTGGLLFKLVFLVCPVLFTAVGLTVSDIPLAGRLAIGVIGGLFIGLMLGAIVSMVAGPPVQVLIEIVRGLCRMGKSVRDLNREGDGLEEVGEMGQSSRGRSRDAA